MRRALLLVSLTALDCSTLQGVTGTANDTKGQLDSAKSQTDSAKDQSKGEGDKAKGGGGGGSGGGSGGSGDDDDRLHAKEGAINTPIDDKVDGKSDRFDWRRFQLQGKAGVATFELHWDEEGANLDLDVFDAYGTNIGRSPPRIEGQQVKKVLVRIETLGAYYVRISAPTIKDVSIYTLAVRWKGPVAPTSVAAPTPTAPAAPPVPAAPPAPTAPAADPNRVPGSIVSAYRDGSTWVLQLDRGSQHKLRAGMNGQILEGPDGDKPVEGGAFTVSEVIDATHAIARAQLGKPLGKNKRFIVNLK